MKVRLYDVLSLPSWEVRDIGRQCGVERWVRVHREQLLDVIRGYHHYNEVSHATLVGCLPHEEHEVPDSFDGAVHLGEPVSEAEAGLHITDRPRRSGLLLNRVYGMDLLMLSYWHQIEEGA